MAFTKKHSGEGAPKKNTNGPVGKSKLHPGPSGSSGYPVKGKGTKVTGTAY